MKKIITICLLAMAMLVVPTTQVSAATYTDSYYEENYGDSVFISLSTSQENYSSVRLNWSSPYQWDKYTVYRATSEYGKYYKVNDTYDNYLTVGSLVTAKTYYFKVRAYNRYGYFESNPIKGTTKLHATSYINLNNNTLNWGAVEGAHGYSIYRAKKGSTTYKKVKATKNTYCSDLKQGYKYKIRAYRKVNGKYKYSEYSSVVAHY